MSSSTENIPWKESCLPRFRGVLNGFASTLCRFSFFYSRVFMAVHRRHFSRGGTCTYFKASIKESSISPNWSECGRLGQEEEKVNPPWEMASGLDLVACFCFMLYAHGSGSVGWGHLLSKGLVSWWGLRLGECLAEYFAPFTLPAPPLFLAVSKSPGEVLCLQSLGTVLEHHRCQRT